MEEGKYNIDILFIGYADYRQELTLNQSIDLGEIILAEDAMQLDEVVITTSMVKRFADKKEYKLTNIEKEQYSSAWRHWNTCPKYRLSTRM